MVRLSAKSFDTAVRIVHEPTNTSAIAVGWYRKGGFNSLIEMAMRTLKARIMMASKAIWSRKTVRTYSDDTFKLDEDEILLKERTEE